jgi:hypothetical protein
MYNFNILKLFFKLLKRNRKKVPCINAYIGTPPEIRKITMIMPIQMPSPIMRLRPNTMRVMRKPNMSLPDLHHFSVSDPSE